MPQRGMPGPRCKTTSLPTARSAPVQSSSRNSGWTPVSRTMLARSRRSSNGRADHAFECSERRRRQQMQRRFVVVRDRGLRPQGQPLTEGCAERRRRYWVIDSVPDALEADQHRNIVVILRVGRLLHQADDRSESTGAFAAGITPVIGVGRPAATLPNSHRSHLSAVQRLARGRLDRMPVQRSNPSYRRAILRHPLILPAVPFKSFTEWLPGRRPDSPVEAVASKSAAVLAARRAPR